ncbi:MAG: hypothetical protein EPGJADBJ_04462 [Saprospiraceae bacterium]|nr:hypothetical protein [Saprospiraceae bacterium]
MKNTLKWLAVAIFLITALSALTLSQITSSVFFFLGAIFCAPPFWPWIERMTNFPFERWQKYFLAISFFVLGCAFMNPKNEQKPREASKEATQQVVTNEKKPDTISTVDALRKEIDFIKGFDESTFRGSLEAAQGELALFYIWKTRIEQGLNHPDPNAQKAAAELKKAVINLQVRDYPKLRKEYANWLHNKTWEHDVDVQVTGKGNTILKLTGYHFAANRNIKEMQEILAVTPLEFRFKQVQYRWYSGANEYQYYDIKPPADSELLNLTQ